MEESFLISKGYSHLSSFQCDIVTECLRKENGGLQIPMGSGKTIISIVVSLMQTKVLEDMGIDGKILVVVAKSLIGSWKDEIKKFFGTDLQVEILHSEYIRKGYVDWIPSKECKIVITTPEVISNTFIKNEIKKLYSFNERPVAFGPEVKYYRNPGEPYLKYGTGEKYLHSHKWSCVIVDEAHNYFNTESGRCLGIASLSTYHRWLLSGTMFCESKPEKLFGYYLMLNDNIFPRNLPDFKLYITDLNYKGVSHTLIKREKNLDFDTSKINTNKVVVSHSLSDTEIRIYTNMKNLLKILRDQLRHYKQRQDTVNVRKFSSYLMAMITYLRQCLICPLIPITSVAIDVADQNERSDLSHIFMDFVNGLGINDWLNDVNSLYSSRIRNVCDTIKKHSLERVVVFSAFRSTIDILKLYIKDREFFTIEGSYKSEKRSQIQEQFKESKDGVLLLTYDVGANGLNLQFAFNVMVVDFWWNAGKTTQAIARILRRGQSSDTINIYYFTSNTGIEAAMLKLQASKLKVEEEVLNGTVISKTSSMKVEELLRLIDTQDNISCINKIYKI